MCVYVCVTGVCVCAYVRGVFVCACVYCECVECCMLRVPDVPHNTLIIFAGKMIIFAANSDEFGTQNALLTGCVSCESLPQNKMKSPPLNPGGTDGTYGK